MTAFIHETASCREGAAGRPTRPTAHAVLCLLAAFLLAVPAEAWGEVLVLKADGERLPCRVLYKDEHKIIVRVGTGTERTLRASEVADILPETSAVEVYEGVAETISGTAGIVPYYLGVWCQENDMPHHAVRLLEMAARDGSWTGRADLALARRAKDPAKRRAFLYESLVADPTQDEVVKALLKEGFEPVEIPRGVLQVLARAIENACVSSYTSAFKKLQTIKEEAAPDVLDALSARMRRGAGLDFDEFMDRCGEGLSAAARGEADASEEAARTDCDNCEGNGFVTCETCGGKSYIVCKQCRGRGIVTKTSRRSDRARSTTTARQCTSCGGKGYRPCRSCLRMPKASMYGTRTLQVEKPCVQCKGEGRVMRRTRTRYTSSTGRTSTINESNDQVCRTCGGRGTIAGTYDMKLTTSGWRRCPLCNKDGKLKFRGPPGMYSRHARRPTRPKPTGTSRTYSRRASAASSRFTRDETQRLKQFANVLSYVTSGQADLLWRSGDKVPLRFGDPSRKGKADAGAEGQGIFVGGKWVTPSTAKLMRQRMEMLKYNPRKSDVAPFFSRMRETEIAYLRGHSVDIGAGADPVASVTGLLSYVERGQAANYLDAFDGARLFRTVFLPHSGGGGKVACRWSVQRRMGEEMVSLLLVRDHGCWPRLEVVATPVPDGGLNMGRLGDELLAHIGSPLTVYYRVASCRRSSRGRGDEALSHVTLDVGVVAAVVGPERRPKKVWIHGTEGLAKVAAR